MENIQVVELCLRSGLYTGSRFDFVLFSQNNKFL